MFIYMYKAYFLPGKFEKGAPHFLPLPGGGECWHPSRTTFQLYQSWPSNMKNI